MSRHYSTREFFRQMPNALLALNHVRAGATPESGGHVHQRVQRETRDAAPQQVIQAWLGDAAAPGGFRLRPSLALYNGGDASRQHNVFYRSMAIVFTI